jgi:hypothetical protein
MGKLFSRVIAFGEKHNSSKNKLKFKIISLSLFLFCINTNLFAQHPVTSATTIEVDATPSSYTDTDADPDQLYEWGQGKDLFLSKVFYNGEEFFFDNIFTQTSYNIIRENGNGGISYDRFGIFAQENTGNFNYAPTLPGTFGSYSMADLLDEPILNRGANDIFKNNAGVNTSQNIERVDVTYVPFRVPNLTNLDKIGFIAAEKDGNSSFKAAAITSIDGSGNPLTFGPVITIQNGDYGIVTADLDFDLLANNSAGANPIKVGDNNQSVGITIITLSDLGIAINDIVYGISFFDSTVPDDADLLDTASFPDANGGGADIFGGLGAIATSIGTISGTVYLDLNGNGTQDSNEAGIENITVSILGSDGGYQTAITDSNGNYKGFVPEGATTITIDESDTDLPPNFTRTEGSNPTIISAIEGEDVNLGNTGYTSDIDNDGVIDLTDVDDDNDGILDTIELTIGITTYDPLGDEDGDLILNYLDTTDNGTGVDGSETDYVDLNSDGIPDVFDFDNDGVPNHFDLDADNDGIPDNIEAQTTNGYIAPSGAVGAGFTDFDGDGLDDNYDPVVSGGTPGTAITPVNSDSATVADNPAYLDVDSDEDGVSDTIEANLTLSGTVGDNGLDNFFDNGDDYTDVNGSFDDSQTDNFPDDGDNANLGLPNDVNWRDIAVTGELDTDNDGIPNSTDIDDDNDGILDTDEQGTQNLSYSFSNMSTLDSRDRGAPNDLNRDFIFESGTAGVDDYIFNLNFDNSTPIIIETTIGDNIVARTGNVTIDGDNQSFSTTAGNFQTLTHTPSTASSYQVEISGEDATLTSIVIRSATDPSIILAQFDFGTDSSNLEPGYIRVSNSNASGSSTVNFLETDTDGDGIPNYLDLDADNDGIPDNIEGQVTDSVGGLVYISPTGIVGANGLDNAYESDDTLSATSYTVVNTDGTDNPDFLDTDSDNDGTIDRIEANLSLDGDVGANGLDANYDNGDNYTDVNGNFDNTQIDNFPDADADVNDGVGDDTGDVDYRDLDSVFTDNDNDGIPDGTDLDDDNDGVLDLDEGSAAGPCPPDYIGSINEEASITNSGNINDTGAPNDTFATVYDAPSTFDWDFGTIYPSGTQYQITWRKKNSLATGAPPAVMDLSESEDDITYTADITPRPENTNSVTFQTTTITSSVNFRYIRLTKGATSTVDYEVDAIAILPGGTCVLDTDGDGVPNYLDLDSDNDGIPDNIEAQTTQGYSAPDGVYDANGVDTNYTGGLTPVDTDNDGTEDYLETDSDNDGISDDVEADLTLTGVYGTNGLDNAYDNGDNYTDVNGSFDNSQTDNFPDQDADVFNDGDVDFRDNTFNVDLDQDGISNDVDLDDDNDGILDTDEGRLALLTNAGFNDFTVTTPVFGDNVGIEITPWILESGTDTNVIQVDGAGGSDYGAGGPEFDATGGTGNYFTVDSSAGVIYQTFTFTETTIVDYGGFISSRNGNTGTGIASIYSGTGSGGTLISTTGPQVATSSSIWTKIGNSVSLAAGTYSLVIELDEDLNFDEAYAFSNIDSDGDGIVDHFDLDADNDGIPDNIEAQTTAGYIAPTNTYSIFGIDLAYGSGLTPVNTDGTDNPDYLDLDSDNEGGFDIVESGAGLVDLHTGTSTDGVPDGVADGLPGVFGINGLIDSIETGEVDLGYTDVNGEYDVTFTTILTDTDGDVNIGGDLDYRDDIVGVDTDGDGIVNADDIDDDNDGILDISENGTGAFVTNVDAFWNLDNTTDDAENSNNSTGGTLPTFVTDNLVEGTHAASFNGTTNTIQYNSGGFMTSTYTDVSFSAWINPDDVSGTSIIYEEGGSTNGLTLWINNGVLTFSTRDDFNQKDVTHPTLLTSTGEWQHVAATFNNGILTVYVNGVPETLDITSDYTSISTHNDAGGIGGQLGTSNAGGTSGFYDGLMDAVRYSNSETWSSSDILTEVNNAIDADGDGVINSLDIDADNDGIPDNVEAQTTLGYVAPTGSVGANGLYNIYGSDDDLFTATSFAINDRDGDTTPDYLDTDSDGDGTFDIGENQISDAVDAALDANTGSSTNGTPDGIVDPSSFVDSDGDGLADIFEGADVNDGYDVNDEINTPSTDLPDADSDVNAGVDANSDVDFRDTVTGDVTPSVAGNLLWLRADLDVTGTTTVTQWDDQSAGAFIATGVTGVEPSKVDNGVNFNPTISFDGTQEMEILLGIYGTANYTNIWTYVVAKPNTSSGKTHFGFEQLDSGDYSVGLESGELRQLLNGSEQKETPASLTGEFSLLTYGSSSNSPDTSPSGSNQAISKNGLIIGQQGGTINFDGNDGDFFVGGQGGGEFLDGDLAEMIIINETPTSLKQQQIESYLAIKYGITLDNTDNDADIVEGDYILSDQSTKIWNYATCATYSNDIAGIGRDDGMALGQYQSKSINTDAIITIGLTAIGATNATNANYPVGAITDANPPGAGFSANKDFLVWGNDNGSLLEADVTETELICAPEKTLERIWKIKETGNVGTTQIAVDKTTLDLALTTPNTVKVLKVADDAAFSTNVEYIPLTSETINSETVYAVDYNFNGTKYFTYAEINGIFWNGNSATWIGGNSIGVTGGPSTNVADRDKVIVIDSESSLTNATLSESVEVECVWIKTGSKLMVPTGNYLEFDEDFILDGEIRLLGDGQLIQTHVGTSNVEGTGKLYKDQASTVPNVYRYHYWSSPVRETGLDTFRLSEVMKDGTNPTTETSETIDINWIAKNVSYDGAVGDYVTDPSNPVPITIANHWIYTIINDLGDGDLWTHQYETGAINRGQGFTMKSTGVVDQNFTFVGTPNDGSITFDLTANTTSLLGNPYASNLDIEAFITSNTAAIDGTVYFWEHTGETSTSTTTAGHNKGGYLGGYSQKNIDMGVAASTPINGIGGIGNLGDYTEPSRYANVGQGFFVSSSTSGGIVRFENSHRAYNADSFFFRNANGSNEEKDLIPQLKIGFDFVNAENIEIHRQVGITFKTANDYSYESGYDSQTYDLAPTDIYWQFPNYSDAKLIIASIGKIKNDLEVPLRLTVDSDKPIYLMIDEMKNINKEVYLLDKVENKLYDLSNPVELDLAKGGYFDRFYITFSINGTTLDLNENEIVNNEVSVFVDNSLDQLVLRNNTTLGIDKITIYNILGQETNEWKNIEEIPENRFELNKLKSGIYFVKIITEDGNKISKKIIID